MERKKWGKQDLTNFFVSLDGLKAQETLEKVDQQMVWVADELSHLTAEEGKLLRSDTQGAHANRVASKLLHTHNAALVVRRKLCLEAKRRKDRDEEWKKAILAIGGPGTLQLCMEFMQKERNERSTCPSNSDRK